MACDTLFAQSRNGVGKMHTMTMITEHEGTEEWFCPVCGRHLLVSWFPGFKRTVLEAGDPYADHQGFRDNSEMDDRVPIPVNKTHRPELPERPFEDPRLRPWIMWMDEVDFERLWDPRR